MQKPLEFSAAAMANTTGFRAVAKFSDKFLTESNVNENSQ